MDVWVMRHAAARDRAPSGRDEDRELTEEGRARAEMVARGLAAMSPAISIVLTSPFRRARETAEACAGALRAELRDFPALLPGSDPARIAAELASRQWKSVLLVGHQPLLGALLGALVFGDERFEVPLRKAAAAHVEWEPGAPGSLEALLPPEILERLVRSP